MPERTSQFALVQIYLCQLRQRAQILSTDSVLFQAIKSGIKPIVTRLCCISYV